MTDFRRVEFREILHTCRGHGARKFSEKKMNRSFPNFEGGGGEVETLTPNISPVGGPGAPQFFLVVGPEGRYSSSKSGAPLVMGRGRGIFQMKFTKMLGQKRGQSRRIFFGPPGNSHLQNYFLE